MQSPAIINAQIDQLIEDMKSHTAYLDDLGRKIGVAEADYKGKKAKDIANNPDPKLSATMKEYIADSKLTRAMLEYRALKGEFVAALAVAKMLTQALSALQTKSGLIKRELENVGFGSED